LEVELRSAQDSTDLVTYGLKIPGHIKDNLILRAHAFLQKHHGISPVHFHLVKSIPMGAGLGGGSSDGAFALRLLDQLFELSLSVDQLEGYAAELGSDCPFFIRNTPSHVTGRGEVIQPIALALDGWWVALIHPGVHIPTPSAFGWVEPNDDRPGLDSWAGTGPDQWTPALTNDFTTAITHRFPEVSQALERMKDHGAVFSDMSGSGSAVLGWFKEEPPVELLLGCPKSWKTWQGPYNV
jgi:4-diphosphocytidyl-2-C-methyl-D-erythritol kinase